MIKHYLIILYACDHLKLHTLIAVFYKKEVNVFDVYIILYRPTCW